MEEDERIKRITELINEIIEQDDLGDYEVVLFISDGEMDYTSIKIPNEDAFEDIMEHLEDRYYEALNEAFLQLNKDNPLYWESRGIYLN